MDQLSENDYSCIEATRIDEIHPVVQVRIQKCLRAKSKSLEFSQISYVVNALCFKKMKNALRSEVGLFVKGFV